MAPQNHFFLRAPSSQCPEGGRRKRSELTSVHFAICVSIYHPLPSLLDWAPGIQNGCHGPTPGAHGLGSGGLLGVSTELTCLTCVRRPGEAV